TMTRRWAFIRGSVRVSDGTALRVCVSRAGAPRVKPIRFPSLRSGPADKKSAYVTWYPSVTVLGYKESLGMSVVVITGAAGLVGSMLRPRLARPGRTLRVLDIAPMAAEPGEQVIQA